MNKRQVELFYDESLVSLEVEVNDWIAENPVTVVTISLSSHYIAYEQRNSWCELGRTVFSMAVLYETQEEQEELS